MKLTLAMRKCLSRLDQNYPDLVIWIPPSMLEMGRYVGENSRSRIGGRRAGVGPGTVEKLVALNLIERLRSASDRSEAAYQITSAGRVEAGLIRAKSGAK